MHLQGVQYLKAPTGFEKVTDWGVFKSQIAIVAEEALKAFERVYQQAPRLGSELLEHPDE